MLATAREELMNIDNCFGCSVIFVLSPGGKCFSLEVFASAVSISVFKVDSDFAPESAREGTMVAVLVRELYWERTN